MLNEILMVCKMCLMKDVVGSLWPDFNTIKVQDIYGKYIASIHIASTMTPKDVYEVLKEYEYQNAGKLMC